MALGINTRRRAAYCRRFRLLTTEREFIQGGFGLARQQEADPRFIRCPDCGGPVQAADPDWMGRQRVACDRPMVPCQGSWWQDRGPSGGKVFVVDHLIEAERIETHKAAQRMRGVA